MDRCKISLSMLLSQDSAEWTEYLCSYCEFLPNEAVQTICGHPLCLECALLLISQPTPHCPREECEKLLMTDGFDEPFFPDRPLRSKIAQTSVRCANSGNGCTWTGVVHELHGHFISCYYGKARGKLCDQLPERCEQTGLLQPSPQIQVACPLAVFCCRRTEKAIKEHLLREHVVEDGQRKYMPAVTSCLKGTSIISLYKKEMECTNSTLSENDRPDESLDIRLAELEVGQVGCQKRKTSENNGREVRPSFPENNFSGSMMWEVTQFSRQLEEGTRSGISTSIISPPFYTSRYGYKLCLSLFPLGYAKGSFTHVSLDLMIMRGEFDDYLLWPFTHKVTIKLIDPVEGDDVIETIVPDPSVDNFRMPTKEMHVAKGLRRFIPLPKLLTGGFVKDGSVIIKVDVDTRTETSTTQCSNDCN